MHYAHLAYMRPTTRATASNSPVRAQPVYWDFVYFAFTCGMAFATSRRSDHQQRMRKVVTFHCLAAFAFNIGVLAFSINLLASSG